MTGMWDGLRYFFETQALSPHGICLLWRPELIWTHAISDIVIGLAYFAIPIALAVFVRKRPDMKFGWAIWMFVAFIMLCGATHFMMVWTLWRADYGIEALLKALTAVVSLITALVIWPLLPKLIAVPSRTVLEKSLAERDAALADLRAAMNTMMLMREHEARQKLLLDELNHRVKNTLASVQSVARQTLKDADDIGDARDLFIDRLMALSSTHNLLVQREWESAPMRELVDATLGPYGRPYDYEGVDLTLDANLAVSVGMALHELTTNAVKYGAWRGSGRVSLKVEDMDGASIRIVWRETGGPAITPPKRLGFGSRLLQRGVAAELGGRVDMDFAPDGLVCTITAPIGPRLQVVRAAA